jgi:hypothetical protein
MRPYTLKPRLCFVIYEYLPLTSHLLKFLVQPSSVARCHPGWRTAASYAFT